MHKKLLLVFGIIAVIFICAIIGCFIWYQSSLDSVGSENTTIQLEVESGSTYTSIAQTLYEKKLIKSVLAYRIYLKLHPPKESLKAGIYTFHQGMDVEEILDTLELGGTSVSPDQISITFKEGMNMKAIATTIEEYTDNQAEDVYTLLKDKEYLESLIEEYWFLDDSILNEDIYYPLEGYLFPDTYYFKNKQVTVSEIFTSLLDEMEKKLESYQEEIEASSYSVHEILTLASIIELEGKTAEDRKGVSGVFYNRLKSNMSLGSDVTTYYGAQVDMSLRDLYQAEIEAENGYNTRPLTMAGKLPVGPICSPSITSIEAALYPTESDYYFFVSDKYGKVYFTKTNHEHEAKIEELQEQGLWNEY